MASPAVAAILNVSFRVTIDTPWHAHRCNSCNSVHGLHGSVTFLTLETRFDVSLVREVHKVGNIMHLDPWNRFTIIPVGGKFQYLRLLTDTRYGPVATHALANAGNAGDGCPISINVTMLARNLVIRGVHPVTEFDGLNRTAVRKIFAVHPCAYEQSAQHHKPKQGWLFRGPERIENRDRQMVPPSFGARVCP